MNTNNNNTATSNNGVTATKAYIDFSKSKVDESYHSQALAIDTFPYVRTKEHEVLYFSNEVRGNDVCYYCQFLCSDFRIKEVYKSEKNGDVLFLSIEVFKDDKWWPHNEIPLSYFSANNLHELKKYGINYNSWLKTHLENYATMLIDHKEIKEKTDKLG